MNKPFESHLSRREREIMDIVYKKGEASVTDVADALPDDPGYNSTRVTLSILAKKGYLQHRVDGRRYIYSPTVSHENASKSALSNLLDTFYRGSPSKAILAMLDLSSDKLTQDDLDEIAALIEKEKNA